MWKQHKEGNLITIILTPHLLKLIKYWYSMAPQRWKVPISIVAVNCIGNTDWLNIMVHDLNPLSPHVLIFLCNSILLISQCMEMNRWLLLHFIYIPHSPNLDQCYHKSSFLHQAHQSDTSAHLPFNLTMLKRVRTFLHLRPLWRSYIIFKLHIFRCNNNHLIISALKNQIKR